MRGGRGRLPCATLNARKGFRKRSIKREPFWIFVYRRDLEIRGLMLPININSRKSLVRIHTVQRACRARSVSLGVKRGNALFAAKVLSIRAYYLSVRVT